MKNESDAVLVFSKPLLLGSLHYNAFAFAVEKVTVIARMLKVDSIQNNQQIKTSLAHAFCYLIGSLDDIHMVVVQRTAIYLETIKVASIKVGIFVINVLQNARYCFASTEVG